MSRKLGERLGASVRTLEPDAEIIEIAVRDLASDLVNRQLTGVASPQLADALGELASADGLIAVSPVMNGSMGGLFKLFFEVIDEGTLRDVPVLLAANGGTAAGAEAALGAGLAAGRSYLNIHTSAFPGGEIRGFLIPEPASLALFGLGFAGLAAARRRQPG